MLKRSPTYSDKKRNSSIWNRSRSKRHSMMIPEQIQVNLIKQPESPEVITSGFPLEKYLGIREEEEQEEQEEEDDADDSATQFEDTSDMLSSAFNDYQLALQALSLEKSVDTAKTTVEVRPTNKAKVVVPTVSAQTSDGSDDEELEVIPRLPQYEIPSLEIRKISNVLFLGYRNPSTDTLQGASKDSYYCENGVFDDTKLIFEDEDYRIKRTSFNL